MPPACLVAHFRINPATTSQIFIQLHAEIRGAWKVGKVENPGRDGKGYSWVKK